MMKEKTLVLLAAGKGSRFGGLKQLHRFQPQNATLAEYAIWDALQAGFDHFVAIVSEETQEEFYRIFKDMGVGDRSCCVLQNNTENICRSKPWGTGHALYVARNSIHTPFIIANGDDFYGREAFYQAAEFLENNSKDFALVGYPLGGTLSPNGYVSRALCYTQENCICQLQECTQIERSSEGIILGYENARARVLDPQQWVSMNFWVLQSSVLPYLEKQWSLFLDQLQDPEKEEFYLPTAIQAIAQQNNISIRLLKNEKGDWQGITYAKDTDSMQQNILIWTHEHRYPSSFQSKNNL